MEMKKETISLLKQGDGKIRDQRIKECAQAIEKTVLDTPMNDSGIKQENGGIIFTNKMVTDKNGGVFQKQASIHEITINETYFDRAVIQLSIEDRGQILEFNSCVFRNCMFNMAEFIKTTFKDCFFIDCRMMKCAFKQCFFIESLFDSGCTFSECDFSGSNFASVNFQDMCPKMKDCTVDGTIFELIQDNLIRFDAEYQTKEPILSKVMNLLIRKEQETAKIMQQVFKEAGEEAAASDAAAILESYAAVLDELYQEEKYAKIQLDDLKERISSAKREAPAVLKGIDLENVDFTLYGKQLAFVQFEGCNLASSNFLKMFLNNVRFIRCSCQGTNFEGINANDVEFSECLSIESAKFSPYMKEALIPEPKAAEKKEEAKIDYTDLRTDRDYE